MCVRVIVCVCVCASPSCPAFGRFDGTVVGDVDQPPPDARVLLGNDVPVVEVCEFGHLARGVCDVDAVGAPGRFGLVDRLPELEGVADGPEHADALAEQSWYLLNIVLVGAPGGLLPVTQPNIILAGVLSAPILATFPIHFRVRLSTWLVIDCDLVDL